MTGIWRLLSILGAIILLLPLGSTIAQDHPSPLADLATLQLKNTFAGRKIAGGETQSFRFAATAGQFAQIVVIQKAIDLVVTLLDEDTQIVARVDRPNSASGPETLSVILPRDGWFIVRLVSLTRDARPGEYDIVLNELRRPQPLDGTRVLAEQAVTKGEVLRAKGDGDSLQGAVKQFQRASVEWELLQDKYELAVSLYGLGLAQRSLGQSQRAVRTFNRSASLFRTVNDPQGEAMAETGLAWALHHVGELPLAITEFLRALTLREDLKDDYGEALTLFGLGSAYAFSNDPDKATEYFNRSLALRRRIGDRRGEALCQIGVGKLQLERGQAADARESLEKGIAILEDTGVRDGEGDALSHLGWALKRLGFVDKARATLTESIKLAQAAGDPSAEALSRFRIANIETDNGHPDEALNEIRRTLSIVEDLRTQGYDPDLKAAFVANVRVYYEFAVDLLESMHAQKPKERYDIAAFEMQERGTARNLVDALAETAAQNPTPIPAELASRRQQLLSAMHGVVDRMARRPALTDDGHSALELSILRMRLYETEEDLNQAALRRGDNPVSGPLRAVEIQKLLDDDSLLLEYALGDRQSYLWAVTRNNIATSILPSRQEIEAAADHFYKLITARNLAMKGETSEARRARITAADEAAAEAGSALTRMLLMPIAGTRVKRLLIVREGKLQMIPFGALLDPHLPLDHSRPLMVDHEIAYLPSASALAIVERNSGRQRSANGVGIVADPVLSRSDERVRRLIGRTSGDNRDVAGGDPGLPRLYASGWEGDAISSLVRNPNVQIKKGFDANRDLLSTPFLNSNVLHFATHSVVNHDHPELSAIALASVNPDGTPRPGFWYAYEIFRLQLPSQLVVLSGCQTSLGKDIPGEGMTGLTTSFLHAGAVGVISTLWPVRDADSADFMVHFYKELAALGMKSPGRALTQAQRAMWSGKGRTAPYFWAAYTLQGQ